MACTDGEDRFWFGCSRAAGMTWFDPSTCSGASRAGDRVLRGRVAARHGLRYGTAGAMGGLLSRKAATGESNVDRAEKQELIGVLQEVFKASGVVVVAHYSGLTVAQMQDLRKQMKQAGATV